MTLTQAEREHWIGKAAAQGVAWLLDVHHTADGYEFTFLRLSPGYEEIVGLKNEDVAGRGPETYDPETADRITYRYTECARSGIRQIYREHLLIAGEYKWWDSWLEPIYRDGRLEGIYGHSVYASDKVETEIELRNAIGTGQGLFLQYQPIRRLSDLSLAGYEALIRWADYGQSPEVWLPVAKDAGLMPDINKFLIDAVAQQLTQLPPEQWISINIDEFEIEMLIADAIALHNLQPQQFALEILEAATITPAVIEEVGRIKAMGCWVKLDDFFTRESNIQRLSMFPKGQRPDSLKVDRQFVQGVDADPEKQAICSAVLLISHAWGLTTVAEGIETDPELAWCRAAGFDYGQGWHPSLGRAGAL